jgi:hypothetical protein
VGLWAAESSSLSDLPGSIWGGNDGLDLVVARDALDAFCESLPDRVAVETLESREGGSGSGKLATEGDCSLDEGPLTITGDDTAVPPGLRGTAPVFGPALLVPAATPSPPSAICSLTPPTEARRRLYRPLRPPDASSALFGSSSAGAGGAVRSSKVVSVSERDAVACIWWSASCVEPRGASVMAAAVWGVSMGKRWCSGT